ncbi:hypothetical protein VIGAN_04106700, partial [Vigna angularis var. angularis]
QLEQKRGTLLESSSRRKGTHIHIQQLLFISAYTLTVHSILKHTTHSLHFEEMHVEEEDPTEKNTAATHCFQVKNFASLTTWSRHTLSYLAT